MGLIQAARPSGGSGPGQTLAWQRDRFEQTDPFSPGFTLQMTQTPVDEDAIEVWSQGEILDTDDYNYLSGPNQIEILFSADPALDTQNGVWVFFIRYPYAT